MNKRKFGTIALAVMITVLLSTAGGSVYAAPKGPMTPELAAKREMVRKQQEQRITQKQRKAGAKALQAERKKVYDAKKFVKNSGKGSPPASIDPK